MTETVACGATSPYSAGVKVGTSHSPSTSRARILPSQAAGSEVLFSSRQGAQPHTPVNAVSVGDCGEACSSPPLRSTGWSSWRRRSSPERTGGRSIQIHGPLRGAGRNAHPKQASVKVGHLTHPASHKTIVQSPRPGRHPIAAALLCASRSALPVGFRTWHGRLKTRHPTPGIDIALRVGRAGSGGIPRRGGPTTSSRVMSTTR